MRRAHLLALALTLGTTCGVALAQEAAPDPQASRLDELEERLEANQREAERILEELRQLRGGAGAEPAPEAPAASGEPAASEEPAAPARAPAASGEPASGAPAEPPIRLGLFFIEGGDGQHRLELNGRAQLDGIFMADRGDDDVDNEFVVRRARVDVSGRIYRRITFRLGLEFGRTSDADLRDAYGDLQAFEWLRLRGGQMLVPFSTERLTSSNYMKFPERPIIIGNIAEQREVGVMVHGRAFDSLITYYLAIFNGNGQNVAKDDDDDKDFATRLEVRPLDEVLLLAASYRYTPTNRRHSRGPADYRTLGNQLSRFLNYALTNRHLASRERGTVDARLRWGPVEVKGELVFDYWRRVRTAAGTEADLMNWGWFVDASVVLTGEEQEDTITPSSPFISEDGLGLGAWELCLRYEELHADPVTLRDGFAAGTRTARSTTAALGWWPMARLRAILSYTYTDFADRVTDIFGNRHGDDHVIVGRMAFYF